jgi:hypothetical protein
MAPAQQLHNKKIKKTVVGARAMKLLKAEEYFYNGGAC